MAAQRRVGREGRQHREARHQPRADAPVMMLARRRRAARPAGCRPACARSRASDACLRRRSSASPTCRARSPSSSPRCRAESRDGSNRCRLRALAANGNPDSASRHRRGPSGSVQPFELGQRRLLLRRTHIGHHDAVALDAGIGRLLHLVLELASAAARSADRGNCRRCRISSRDTSSAGRIRRSCRNRATRRDARNARAAGPACPSVSRNAIRSSPSSRTRTGAPSASTSRDSNAGSQ